MLLILILLPLVVATLIGSRQAQGDIITKSYAATYTSDLKLIDTIEMYSVRKDQEFLYYLHTIIHVESDYNPKAISSAGAIGLMQLTGLAVVDAAKFCDMPLPVISYLTDPDINVMYGTCYMQLLLDKYSGDWYNVLAAYHGGFRAAEKLRKGKLLNSNTANYVVKVLYLMRNLPRPGRREEEVSE